MTTESPAARTRFAGVVTAVFVVATLPRLLAHELWRDEAWLWLVATESGSLAELFATLGRSGQGYLFPLLCYGAAQLWESPRTMQLLHLAIAAGGAFAFVRWAPLSRAVRVLFVFGYFPFYEYAVISRHYALGALLLWLGCHAAQHRSGRSAVALGACIALLCQTTVYGYILAIALAAGVWVRWRGAGDASSGASLRPGLGGGGVAGLALALIGAAAGLVQLIPAKGTSFAVGWRFGWDGAEAMRVLAAPWRIAVPLPPPRVQFWNANLLDPWPIVQTVGGVALLALAVVVLWPRRVALVTFAVGAAGLLGFGYVKYLGVLRHGGHWWLLAFAACWLAGGWERSGGRRSWRHGVVLGLLVLHLAAALFASAVDLRHPFTNGPATAELLRRSGLEHLPLLGWREPPAASVALALGEPLYAPSRQVYTTRPDWGPLQREMSPDEVRCIARDLAEREGTDVVLVVTRPLPDWEELEPAGSRLGAIAPNEDFHLYRLHRSRLQATAAGCEGGTMAP